MDALLDFIENGLAEAWFIGYGAGFIMASVIMAIRGITNMFVRIVKG